MPMSPRLLRPIASGVHPEAAAWRSAVVANGGSVSVGTLAAVNTFANAIDAAGIRDRFYRLNLFAGTGLNACLVPLYRGPSRTGTQYGNSTDTNVGTFASADYQETGSGGGLKGDGTNNYLNTGVLLPTLSSVDFHVSGYVTVTTVNSFRSITGASGTNGFLFGSSSPSTTRAFFWGGGNNSLSAATHPTGLQLLTQTGNKTGGIYFDDALDTSSYANANNTDGDFSAGSGSLREIPVFVENRNTSIVGHYDGRLAGYSLGAGMTAAQVEDYYDILQAFQTSLGRNV